jgi:hypothetical protein
MPYCRTFFPSATLSLRVRRQGTGERNNVATATDRSGHADRYTSDPSGPQGESRRVEIDYYVLTAGAIRPTSST